MAWYFILLIVLACLMGVYLLGFLLFITNADGKLIEKIYNFLKKHHDESEREEKI